MQGREFCSDARQYLRNEDLFMCDGGVVGCRVSAHILKGESNFPEVIVRRCDVPYHDRLSLLRPATIEFSWPCQCLHSFPFRSSMVYEVQHYSTMVSWYGDNVDTPGIEARLIGESSASPT